MKSSIVKLAFAMIFFSLHQLYAQTQSVVSTVKGKQFIIDSQIPWQAIDDVTKRKIMSYDSTMMMVKVIFEKGGVGKPHKHFHTQMSYVESGVFEVTIGGKTQTLGKGDGFYVPSNVVHGAVCKQAGVLIDIFAPMREDFVK